ncbi:MAG: peptide/nickel transport system permease protein [Candidatus Binatia bacterium]|jgi:peptide/nickel transport system permease protein
MIAYIARRLATALPTALGVATLAFFLLHLVPGDAVDVMLGETATAADKGALRHDLGLDLPLGVQYLQFVSGLAHGDLGTSMRSGLPVSSILADRAGATAALALAAIVLSLMIALPLGCIAALRPNTFFDRAALGFALAGVAIPNFWLGPMLILVFSVNLGLLPVSGAGTPAHFVLPAITLGASMAGLSARLVRSTVLETLREDYVRTARAKGLSETVVVMRHALGNALTPMITIVGLEAGALLGGAVVTETIFAWPGIGRLVIEAISARDLPLVRGCVLAIALTYVVVNLIADLAYAWADPRIRYE